MKRILGFNFTNLKLKQKLLISYILIVVIPVAILGCSCYFYFSAALLNKVILISENSNEQIIKNIDGFWTSIVKLSEYPNLDAYLNKILQKRYDLLGHRALIEKINDTESAKSALYRGVMYLNPLINSVFLVPENSEFIYWKNMEQTFNLRYDITKEHWYPGIIKAEGKEVMIGLHRDYATSRKNNYVVSVGRSIVNPYSKINLGIIIINIRASDLENLWRDISLTKNSEFILLDQNEFVVYSKNSHLIGRHIKNIPQLKEINYQTRLQERMINGQEYFVNHVRSDYCNWRIISLIPKKELFKEVNWIGRITVVLSVLLITAAIGISTIIATSITKPIFDLKNTMKEVEHGNLNVKVNQYRGEIGELGAGFNKMVTEMRTLIDDIYQKEQEKRSAELAVLQSQINPHFLFNTLNSIKWMANIQGSKGIVNSLNSLIELLTFTAKVQGDFISIQKEMEILGHYLNILSLRFYNKFTVEYEIAAEVYQYATLKFLLQPIVENSIFHGFENNKKPGMIKIRIEKTGDRIIYEVFDNGKGIKEENIARLLNPSFAGSGRKFNQIGLANVNERIKMIYGNEYGLQLTSKEGEYTRVTVMIPAIQWENGRS